MRKRTKASCHPDRSHYSRGLCRPCYAQQPDIAAREAKWRKSEKRKSWAREYEKGDVKAASFRRYRHSFDAQDEARFKATTVCDWCGLPFISKKRPSIDHDRRCCNSSKHCRSCTRGFVHQRCNVMAIPYYEWVESKFGFVDVKLADYRKRFPVPRNLCQE